MFVDENEQVLIKKENGVGWHRRVYIHLLCLLFSVSHYKRRQKAHIEYDLVGFIPVDELMNAEKV